VNKHCPIFSHTYISSTEAQSSASYRQTKILCRNRK